ncbi:MAG: sialidase family protein [Phycisphaerales bacterium]|jgi:hypothetical protein|nr:sialidase family protein [Phycisphaerales bacterium]
MLSLALTACLTPIPVDLATRSDLHTTVDREAGQYLGHPSTHLASDGTTLLCVYPKGHGRGPLVLKRSEDGGRTWSDRLPVPDSWASSKETPHLYELEDAAGVRRLLLFSGLHPIRTSISEDGGDTWTELEAIGAYGGIVAVADVMPTGKPGCYSAFFHDDGRFLRPGGGGEPGFKVYAIDTTTGGLTWSEPRVVAADSFLHLCEPGLVRSPTGDRWAMLLRENSRAKNSHVCFSDDHGVTWSTPRELPAALTGDRHQAVYLTDGRLLVSFRDTHPESPWLGDWVAWIGTWDALAGGVDGEYRIRLSDNHHRWDCAYPAIERLADGTVVAITYGHWVEGEQPFIRAVHVSPAELARFPSGGDMSEQLPAPPSSVQ